MSEITKISDVLLTVLLMHNISSTTGPLPLRGRSSAALLVHDRNLPVVPTCSCRLAAYVESGKWHAAQWERGR